VLTIIKTFFPSFAFWMICSFTEKISLSMILTLCLFVLSIVEGSSVFTSNPNFLSFSSTICGSVAGLIVMI